MPGHHDPPSCGWGVVSYGYFWDISTISSKGGMQLAQFCEMIAMIVIFVKAADKMMTKNQALQSNWSTALCSSYSLSFSQTLYGKTCCCISIFYFIEWGVESFSQMICLKWRAIGKAFWLIVRPRPATALCSWRDQFSTGGGHGARRTQFTQLDMALVGHSAWTQHT